MVAPCTFQDCLEIASAQRKNITRSSFSKNNLKIPTKHEQKMTQNVFCEHHLVLTPSQHASKNQQDKLGFRSSFNSAK